ncbi:CPBP family intramembrane glutamic endopeptidase [Actinoplanes sp. ATCC 53533]|uniref:CPBP family intramembrane glutamic endopeptidase n=1 Tax=Actinoplanes sp. ATCC 53533 TaxID=1288362 RepID=UPI001315437A|nr:CPBP family intramembrane glutamic endopeptidase [Actinoplanes sp. ATCC 53533]
MNRDTVNESHQPRRGHRRPVTRAVGAGDSAPTGHRPAERGVLRRRLLEFSAVCLVLTWIPWALLGVLGVSVDEGPGSLVFALAASGPSLAALVMWLRHRGESRPGPRTRWSLGAPAVAVLLGGIAPGGAAVLMNLTDLPAIPQHAGSVIADVGGPLIALAYTLLAGPVAEEFGWRGYVQPRLRRSCSRMATTMVLGAAWGLWHVPLYFLPGTGQHDTGLFTHQGLVFFLGLLPLTHLMLFVTERLRGGVPAAILMHAAWNLTDELVPPLGTGGQWLKLLLLSATAAVVGLLWLRATPVSQRHPDS